MVFDGDVLYSIKGSLGLLPVEDRAQAIARFIKELAEDPFFDPDSVTIGYDAPWRTIHELLIRAALKTEGILPAPAPFVLQTALNDFYVTYEINAYTRDANHMANLYAGLHQNIQDSFNEAGVEIMSAHYSYLRDGNAIAIPDNYRPEGYAKPSFGVSLEKKDGEKRS